MAKAKGTTLLPLVKFLRGQRERSLAALPAPLHHYLDDRIHPSSWYPEDDLLALLRVAVALLPGGREENLERLGQAGAREHLEGVYGHLKSDDTATFMRRSVALWASQHDSGSFQVEPLGEGQARFEVRDFASPSDEMCSVFKGYFAEAMRAAGWSGVRVEKRSCVLHGADACTWVASWREKR